MLTINYFLSYSTIRNDKFSSARTRDSTIKLIYGGLFQFLVDELNRNKNPIGKNLIRQCIQILDIPGFGTNII